MHGQFFEQYLLVDLISQTGVEAGKYNLSTPATRSKCFYFDNKLNKALVYNFLARKSKAFSHQEIPPFKIRTLF